MHADALRDAERKVVEAAKAFAETYEPDLDDEVIENAEGGDENDIFDGIMTLDAAVDALLALEAATCEACKGNGEWLDSAYMTGQQKPCPECKGTGRKDGGK